MELQRHRLCAMLATLLVSTAAWSAQSLSVARSAETLPGVDSLFLSVMVSNNSHDFEAALGTARLLGQRFPTAPTSALAMITIYQTIMESYRVRTYEAQYDSLIEVVVDLAKRAYRKDKRSGRSYFYLATAHGARSLSYARRGKWLQAFRDGTRIKSYFEKAVQSDPELYDAYHGLGVYNYWLGAKARILRAFMPDKNEAINQVKLAMERGRYLNTTAAYALSAIYVNENAFDKALALCDKLYESYPDNPTLNYRRGIIYQKQESWQLAKQAFSSLLDVLTATEYQSRSYQTDCLLLLAQCEDQLQQREAAGRHYSQALKLKKTLNTKRDLELRHGELTKELAKLAVR